jgi:hypothetical protein
MRPLFLLAGLLLVAVGAVTGFAVAERTLDPEREAVTVTQTTTSAVAAPAPGLPDAVAAKVAALRRAAERGDVDGLARLTAPGFTYTLGGPVDGGAAAWWREAQRRGEAPLEALAAILELPYTLSGGIYVWPFAYDKAPAEVTPYGTRLLARVPQDGAAMGPDGYLGWRAGIRPDGSWIYLVAGD